jgi:hypothetical protein
MVSTLANDIETGGLMVKREQGDQDPEIIAISAVYASLKDLNSDAQKRVLSYVSSKLSLTKAELEGYGQEGGSASVAKADEAGHPTSKIIEEETKHHIDDELEGISPVARKWMQRNGLNAKQLAKIFSLGVDEIDLVAKTVPGGKKKEKMRSVFLLKGVAAYVGSGVARFTYEQAKEACLHYDAYDVANFSKYFRDMAPEVSGTKDSGYQLTARGLTAATEILKTITEPSKVG